MPARAPLHVWWHPSSLLHGASGHPERPDRLLAARRGVEAWDGDVDWHRPGAAPRAWIEAVHDPAHVAAVEAASRQGAWFDTETYTNSHTWTAARHAVGAAVAAAESASRGEPAWSLTRPPGHHATRHRAMGFCLLNNIAVAAEHLARTGHRVAVLDVDVHHGNGTQDIFYDRGDVLYVSLHQWPHFPGTGPATDRGVGDGYGATLDLPVPPGTGHDGWLEVLDGAALPALDRWDPDVVLVSTGFDGHVDDFLADLRLVAPTFHAVFARLRDRFGGHVGAVLEGGYDLDAVQRCTTASIAGLMGTALPEDCREPVPEGHRPWEGLREVLQGHPLLS